MLNAWQLGDDDDEEEEADDLPVARQDGPPTRAADLDDDDDDGLISHTAFLKSFCRSQLPHKSVILSLTITNIKEDGPSPRLDR